jgi:hypothetical protein
MSLKPVEDHHGQKRDSQLLPQLGSFLELLHRVAGQNRGCGIECAWLGQREEPLDVVVNRSQLVVGPLLNLVQITTSMIWLSATVKPDDP